MVHPGRRAVTIAIAGLGGALTTPAIISARAQSLPRLKSATLRTGISVICGEVLAKHRYDRAHGVEIEMVDAYPSVPNYYNDFINGSLDVAIGSWDVFSDMANRGIPLRMLCTISTATMVSVISDDPAVKDAAQLAGRTLAATQAAGSTRMSGAVIADRYKVAFGREITLQNAASPAAAVTLALAGSVPAALSWEPDVSIGIAQKPSLHPVFNLGDSYKALTGDDLPYFGFAIRREALQKYPDIGTKLAATFADVCSGIMTNTEDAIALAAPKMRVPPEAVRTAFSSGRLVFKFIDMTEPAGQAILRKAARYMHSHGAMEAEIGDGFFA